jgi:hypothetical protein
MYTYMYLYTKIQTYLHIDLPRSAICIWCDFFLALSSDKKTEVLEQMWEHLTTSEQTAVISDLRVFISAAVKDAGDQVTARCRNVNV